MLFLQVIYLTGHKYKSCFFYLGNLASQLVSLKHTLHDDYYYDKSLVLLFIYWMVTDLYQQDYHPQLLLRHYSLWISTVDLQTDPILPAISSFNHGH